MSSRVIICAIATLGSIIGHASSTRACIIVADFENNPVGNFVTEYQENGIVFTSDQGAGLSFLNNLLTGDIGILEATASPTSLPVTATLPALAESVTVSFFLAQDDFVELRAYDEQGSLIVTEGKFGPATPGEYLALTVSRSGIASVQWNGSSDTILAAGELIANVAPGPGALAMIVCGACGGRMRRRAN